MSKKYNFDGFTLEQNNKSQMKVKIDGKVQTIDEIFMTSKDNKIATKKQIKDTIKKFQKNSKR